MDRPWTTACQVALITVLFFILGTPNKTVQKSVKSFWDTDFESDAEVMPAIRRDEFKENHTTGIILNSIPT